MNEAVIIDGIPCYAPDLAHGSGDYPTDAYDELCRLEEGHFWFKARNRIILQAFRKYLAGRPHKRVLEIGCGTGYVLNGLASEGQYDLTGTEVHIAGLRHARRRLPNVQFAQVDARHLPYRSEFDAIGAFDVIEHIAEDETVLQSIHDALKPGGIVIISVPQHAWLWSAVDERAGHKRRYARKELVAKLKSAQFDVLHVTSFVTALLPLMYAMRLGKRNEPITAETGLAELRISAPANAVCGAAMRVDEALIGAGVSLPAGGSLLVVGRKSAEPAGAAA